MAAAGEPVKDAGLQMPVGFPHESLDPVAVDRAGEFLLGDGQPDPDRGVGLAFFRDLQPPNDADGELGQAGPLPKERFDVAGRGKPIALGQGVPGHAG